MKKLNFLLIAILFSGISMAQTTWTIDKEHSSVSFSASHFGITRTPGYFKDFDATLSSKTMDFTGATITFSARTASICTFNEQRDHHLQSDDFFDAAKYPEIRFTGTLLKENGRYLVKGNLTIRDITKPVQFPVTYNGRAVDSSFKMDKISFRITGAVNRLDYGLKWNETFQGGGPIVGDKVELDVIAEMNRGK